MTTQAILAAGRVTVPTGAGRSGASRWRVPAGTFGVTTLSRARTASRL